MARYEIDPYDFRAAARLSAALGVSHTLAQVLVRRGLASPAAARAFLAADVSHPLSAFSGLAAGAEVILRHIEAGSRITVHGDYDVDGVCSTAILVRALKEKGADVDWYLPSRMEDGYGLSSATVERLARRGTRLLVTADCGITSVDEIAAAPMEVVVTDHHAPRADGVLPDAAAIVHARGNPCPDLCAAGVAYKLAATLGADADRDLDLVALATVADVVPLHDENRALVRAGLRALRVTEKPGLRALMDVARVDPSGLDATAIGFRLAPRINAAGRLARADAGLELVLTTDAERARAVAEELDTLNQRRRDTETRMLFAAEAQVRELEGDQPAYVLTGDDWHPGVIGIVAARIAERRCRPTVLIAFDGDEGTGSGRSVPAFDLLGGFDAGARHLLRHGGHRAAAGLTIRREDVDAFREAFCAHAAETLSPADLVPVERLDAVVGPGELGMELAEELRRLEPFGAANPPVTLLVPAATCTNGQAMGEGERHVRFRLGAARAVRFGEGVSLPDGCVDAAVRLEVNAFNGTVEPRVLLRRTRPSGGDIRILPPNPPELGHIPSSGGFDRETRAVHGQGVATIADLVAAGETPLVVCAHAEQRREALKDRVGDFVLTTWHEAPAHAADYEHVVALDPSPFDAERTLAGAGFTHLTWNEAELAFAQAIHVWEHTLDEPLREVYRALRAGVDREQALRGDGRWPRTPAFQRRLEAVLEELDLNGGRVDLRDSPTYVDAQRALREGFAWLKKAA